VGEVAAIRSLKDRLKSAFPSCDMVVSTVTPSGNELARKTAGERETVIYLPVDISFVVSGILRRINPKALVIAETEIWPNLILACHNRKIPVAVVNGRISGRAFKRYKIIRFLLRRLLDKIDVVCAQTEADGEKFVSLGAPRAKVKVTGNTKYCNTDYADLKKDYAEFRKKLGVREGEAVLVAGSTHAGEEEIVIGIFRKLAGEFDNLRLIIAPRHVERAADVKKLARGLNASVIDRIGALMDAYAIADIVFVGGSLVRHGGQNIIEPAVFSKPVIFGPHMFNFEGVAAEFLRGGAAIQVDGAPSLEAALRRLLRDGRERARLGENARSVVLKNQGAVEACLGEIKRVLR
jgi:3-deoxy-D-manno-octulosonic-acid transferase